MREKMRAHLGNKHPNRFDIKADAGGITDIEFITQYLVLRYASDKPKLTRWSDNVRILEPAGAERHHGRGGSARLNARVHHLA